MPHDLKIRIARALRRPAIYRLRAQLSSVVRRDGHVPFRCNVCGAANRVPPERFSREVPSCAGCGSSVRMRAVIRCLSLMLFGRSLCLTEMPADRSRRGLGISDWEGYATRLAALFSYENTFFHTEPLVDIADPPQRFSGAFDFVIASDVLEHVAPPAQRGFAGAFSLLKPGGALVFSVPFMKGPQTIEHFPTLYDYQLLRFGEEYYLLNRRADGSYELFDNLIFHGGPGDTLEMRFFCESDLLDQLERAGFEQIAIHTEHDPWAGVIHEEVCSVPITARRPEHARAPAVRSRPHRLA
jgi:SAM-dependent methyltransferase